VTPSIGDQGVGGEPAYAGDDVGDDNAGPDPVIGAGITLLGIFMMGTGGARDAHYVFDFGVLVAVLGAMTFVLFVALSAMKLRRARAVAEEELPASEASDVDEGADGAEPPAPHEPV
jgi:hypothetical protein